jgi:hypothetical protein
LLARRRADLETNVITFIETSGRAYKEELVQAEEEYQRRRAEEPQKNRIKREAFRVSRLLPTQPVDGLVLAIEVMGENLMKLARNSPSGSLWLTQCYGISSRKTLSIPLFCQWSSVQMAKHCHWRG